MFNELTDEALYEIQAGGIIEDIVNEVPKAYDAAKSFVQGFIDGWNE